MTIETGEEVTITVCPDGPLLVRGAVELMGADGEPMDVQRNVIALCRCGGTRRPPFCDSTHKKRKSRRAEQSAHGKDEGGEP